MDTPHGRFSRRTLIKAAGVSAVGATAAYCGLDHLGLLPSGLSPTGLSGRDAPLPEPPADQMTYRTHAGSGDKVSLLGFGCMRLPVLPDAASPRSTDIDEPAAFALVDYALAHGVNYFDTAWGYHGGASETVMGKALKRHPRESFYLATKMPSYLDPTLAEAKEIFAAQLQKCQVDYFDYYLLHTLSSVDSYRKTYEQRGVLDFLLEQKARGRIRNLGWSFHGDSAMLEYALSRPVAWDFAMVQLNYHDMLHQYIVPPNFQGRLQSPAPVPWMFETLRQSGLPLIVMEPLLGGRLARLNRKTLAVLQEERPQDSAAAWAFRYAGGLPNVLTVLSGMTYLEHVQDNIRTYAPLTPLSAREQDVLKNALSVFVTAENIRCTTCGYCMPCPYGVDIPAVFRHHNNCLDDEQVPKGERDAQYAQARRAYLVNLARQVPELRTAARCTGCDKCVKLCPQFIDIPGEMARLGSFVEQLKTQG